MRRIIMVIVLLGLSMMPQIQTMLLASLALANICYLKVVRPYKVGFSNKLEMLNDTVAYLVALISSCFFAAYPEYPDREQESNFKLCI